MSKRALWIDVDTLKTQVTEIQPDDLMAEAGRKILLKDFIRMLQHETGSRTGEDIEDVHDMRVATRRMRTALSLLDPYFKSKVVRGYRKELKRLADALGQVRDLDVLIKDVGDAIATLDDDAKAGFNPVLTAFYKKRNRARKKLIAYLDSKDYRKFCAAYAGFLTTPGQNATAVDENSPDPAQVRHIVPVILHEYLALVRAYDPLMNPDSARLSETLTEINENGASSEAIEVNEETTLPDADVLHRLRITFKRLRYATTYFLDVLGTTGEQFIDEIKVMQDILGRLQDIRVAEELIADLIDSGMDETLLAPYLERITAEHRQLEAGLLPAWDRFNTRNVQSKLSNALLVLR